MPKLSSDGRVWIAAEVPAAIADQFREKARVEDRSTAAHLRRLIRQHVSDDDGAGQAAAPNDDATAGNGREVTATAGVGDGHATT